MRHRSQVVIMIAALGAAPLLVPTLVSSTLAAPRRQDSSGRRGADPAAHWPRFRGPSSNPTSENPNLPVSWSKIENVEWVADVPGIGWSSPVVWGNRVFITAARSDRPMKQPSLGVDYSNEYIAELRRKGLSAEEINKKLYERDREMPDEIVISLMLYCYDLQSGKLLWDRQLYKGRPAGGRHSKNSFASETPTTDGERVYVYLTDYGLFAYDFQGRQAWSTPLKSQDRFRLSFPSIADPADVASDRPIARAAGLLAVDAEIRIVGEKIELVAQRLNDGAGKVLRARRLQVMKRLIRSGERTAVRVRPDRSRDLTLSPVDKIG